MHKRCGSYIILFPAVYYFAKGYIMVYLTSLVVSPGWGEGQQKWTVPGSSFHTHLRKPQGH